MVHLTSDRFHRHTLAQLLARSIQLLGQEWQAYTMLAVILVVPSFMFNAVYFEHMHKIWKNALPNSTNNYNNYNSNGNNPDDMQDLVDAYNKMMAGLALLVIVIMFLATVVIAAMIRTTIQAFLSSPVTLLNNMHHALNRLPHMILWFVLYIVGLLVYMIVVFKIMVIILIVADFVLGDRGAAVVSFLFYVGYIFVTYYISLVLVFCMPVIVVERVSAWRSFFRAWEMAEGHRCMILCTLLIMLLAVILVFFVEYLVFHNMGFVTLGIVHGLTQFIWIPMGTIVITMLYINVRIDKEGCNAQVLTGELVKGDADLGLPSSTGGTDAATASASAYSPISIDDTPLVVDDESNDMV